MQGPSKYGGIAAVFVLGVGLLIVGFNLPSQQQDRAVSMRWAGVVILIAGSLVLALAASRTPARKMLIIVLAALIHGGMFGYHAAHNEMTGTARYHHNFFSKSDTVEPVTRETSPIKFRKATNFLWANTAISIFIAAVSFACHRGLKD